MLRIEVAIGRDYLYMLSFPDNESVIAQDKKFL